MFNLESLEKKLLIFFLVTLLLGSGIAAYKKSFPAGNLRIESSSDQSITRGRDISKKSAKVNINKATAGELMDLKGIGKTLAGRIVECRQNNGPFISAEDLKKVSGIGDKLFSKIKDSVSLE